MKNIIYFICGIMAALAVSSCTKELAPVSNQDRDLVLVNLQLSGEVTVDEIPFTKVLSSNDLIGIQVYQGSTPYAYGLFDNMSDLGIYLHEGKEYTFKAQLIKDGKTKLSLLNANSGNPCYAPKFGSMRTSKTDGEYYEYYDIMGGVRSIGSRNYFIRSSDEGYGVPFCFNERAYDGGSPSNTVSIAYTTLKPIYFSSGGVKGYQFYGRVYDRFFRVANVTNCFKYDGALSLAITNSDIEGQDPVFVDRYYGEATYKACNNQESLPILMKHLVYGIQCNVTGVTDGTASITIKNGNKTLLSKNNISGEFHSSIFTYAFSDMHGAWQYSDNYAENITISMTWLRGVGVLQDLGSRVVQVKRNCVNVITVALGTTVVNAAQCAKYKNATLETTNEDVSCIYEVNNVTIQ